MNARDFLETAKTLKIVSSIKKDSDGWVTGSARCTKDILNAFNKYGKRVDGQKGWQWTIVDETGACGCCEWTAGFSFDIAPQS